MRRTALAVLLLCCSACEDRPALNAGQARAVAERWLLRAGHEDWGNPLRSAQIPGRDADGRRWWLLEYAPGTDGRPRQAWIDRDTRWVRTDAPAGLDAAAPKGSATAASDTP